MSITRMTTLEKKRPPSGKAMTRPMSRPSTPQTSPTMGAAINPSPPPMSSPAPEKTRVRHNLPVSTLTVKTEATPSAMNRMA